MLSRVATLDHHVAVRTGVEAILHAQHDIEPVGSAGGAHELWPLLHRTRPDVVVLDSLELCLRVKARRLGPRVVVYSASGDDAVVAARLAEADAIVDKGADVRELLEAIRAVARGERALPKITRRLQVQAAERLAPRARAIFAMRLAGTPPGDIASTAGLSPRELVSRSAAIVAALGAA